MGPFVRGAMIVVGLLLMLGGLAGIVIEPDAAPAGLWAVALGGFLVIVPFIERQRYRSEAAEKGNATSGPGGGEVPDGPVEPRFRPTAEVFVDPTSGRRMRVLVDPRTGERRYVAEG